MRASTRRILTSAVASATALLVAGSVLAHGAETFMNAEPTLVLPGDGVALTADLLTSGPVRLSLAGSDGSRREVGLVDETTEGHFEVVVQVPRDLAPGIWTILAEADQTVYGSATIEVRGSAPAAEGGGQGPRDEDDALVVPLPSGWKAVRSSPTGGVPPGSASVDDLDLVPFVSLGAAVAALAVLLITTRRRHRGAVNSGAR